MLLLVSVSNRTPDVTEDDFTKESGHLQELISKSDQLARDYRKLMAERQQRKRFESSLGGQVASSPSKFRKNFLPGLPRQFTRHPKPHQQAMSCPHFSA